MPGYVILFFGYGGVQIVAPVYLQPSKISLKTVGDFALFNDKKTMQK